MGSSKSGGAKQDNYYGTLAGAICIGPVTAVDELFVSDRDGQPLVVTYGKYPAGMNARIVVYEKNGADGKRFVGYNSGAVELVDDARFNELVTSSTAPK